MGSFHKIPYMTRFVNLGQKVSDIYKYDRRIYLICCILRKKLWRE
ncbi:hypothetical protein CRENPOLYSF1_290010 [Crenothrix polyspora]|uniref:Uncharacterized protein n=1 Tax=Crenothrix polyspora TaxID=360316 RepID=A0A1R4H993_9GAMM|nr:hypothetical protein CRENPOLYSF1_290010 [Crenothrix polyspora]